MSNLKTSATEVAVNLRTMRGGLTGAQRYTTEILSRLGRHVQLITGPKRGRGPLGHIWEQIVLPGHLHGQRLWSPSNTGPIAVRNQVVTIHDLVPIHHPEWFTREFSLWWKTIVPRLVQRVHHVIAVSDFTRRSLVTELGVPEDRVTTVHNGVSERFNPRPAREIEAVRDVLQLPERYVLALNTIRPGKNIPALIAAWSSVRNQLPKGLELVLAGAIANDRMYRGNGLSDVPDGVRFVGAVSDEHLPALYSGADIFVLPSTYEGFGLPVLEAMACGAAAIASSQTAVPEVVADAGVLGDTSDTRFIAAAILQLVENEDLRIAYARKGRERAAAFSWDKAAARTSAILQDGMDGQ